MDWWWSWLLMAVGVTGLYFAGRKRALGWGIGLGAQVLWFAYAVLTDQWGFIVSCLAYGGVYAKNFIAWRREARECGQLTEQGRQLASERDDLIAAGADPSELEVPIAPRQVTHYIGDDCPGGHRETT